MSGFSLRPPTDRDSVRGYQAYNNKLLAIDACSGACDNLKAAKLQLHQQQHELLTSKWLLLLVPEAGHPQEIITYRQLAGNQVYTSNELLNATQVCFHIPYVARLDFSALDKQLLGSIGLDEDASTASSLITCRYNEQAPICYGNSFLFLRHCLVSAAFSRWVGVSG